MRKKVFITGSTGFIGSNLLRRLVSLENIYDVHILVRKTSSMLRIKDILSHVTCHYGDLLSKAELTRTLSKISPNIIFHLANLGVYGGQEGKIKDVVNVNFLGTLNLIEASSKLDYDCFINTGSSSEYGAKSRPMSEADICEPQGIYAVSKLAATLYAKDYANRNNRPLLTLRIFSPFGPYDDSNRLIPYVMNQIKLKKDLILSTKTSVRDFIYIDDVVDSYFQAITRIELAKGKIINIGSGKQTTVYSLINKIRQISGSKQKIIWGDLSKPRYQSPVWQADIKNAEKILDWKPKHSLNQGIKKTLIWSNKNKSL